MGAALSPQLESDEDGDVFVAGFMHVNPAHLVVANVYDCNPSFTTANNIINAAHNVGGIFHCGIEVHGKEWSFGNGVYSTQPRELPAYRKSISLGVTHLDAEQAENTLLEEKELWRPEDYDLLSRNCIDFCQRATELLGVNPLPPWVGRFPDIGSAFKQKSSLAVKQLEDMRTSIESWVTTRDGKEEDKTIITPAFYKVMYHDDKAWKEATVFKHSNSSSSPNVRICILLPPLNRPEEGIWIDLLSDKIAVPSYTGARYKKGDWVEYLSDAYGRYLVAQVIEDRGEEIRLNVKQGEWLSKKKQQLKVRHYNGKHDYDYSTSNQPRHPEPTHHF